MGYVVAGVIGMLVGGVMGTFCTALLVANAEAERCIEEYNRKAKEELEE